MLNISMGMDPEIFLSDGDGNPVTSVGRIGGTKDRGRPIPTLPGLEVLEDNVTLEFNMPPVSSYYGLAMSSASALRHIQKEVLDPQGLYPLIRGTVMFSDADLDNSQAQEFGCAPDFDAYKEGGPKRLITPKRVGNMRCAAGHIHIGYDVDECKVPDYVLVQFLDAFATFFYRDYWSDLHGERRKLYGSPGTFRPKPYGFEYRTPDNSWLIHNERSITYLRQIQETVTMLINNEPLAYHLYGLIDWKRLRTVMRNSAYDSKDYRTMNNILYQLMCEMHDASPKVLTELARSLRGDTSRLAADGTQYEAIWA